MAACLGAAANRLGSVQGGGPYAAPAFGRVSVDMAGACASAKASDADKIWRRAEDDESARGSGLLHLARAISRSATAQAGRRASGAAHGTRSLGQGGGVVGVQRGTAAAGIAHHVYGPEANDAEGAGSCDANLDKSHA